MVDLSQFPRETYALVEEKTPFGKVLAPLLLTVLVLAGLVMGGKVFFNELLRPIAARLTALSLAPGWLPYLVGGTLAIALTLALYAIVAGRVKRVNSKVEVMEREIEQLRLHLELLKGLTTRIEKLEHHTDISGLEALLAERFFEAKKRQNTPEKT